VHRMLAAAIFMAVLGAAQVPPPARATPGGGADAVAGQVLGIGDQVVISASDVPGISDKPFRVETDGTVALPLVGRIRAEGLTVEQFRRQIVDSLKTYVRSPEVSVQLLTKSVETIVLGGMFKNPGVHELPVRRTLLDVISAVGGLQPNASNIKITRPFRIGGVPLPSGSEDPESKASTATVSLKRLLEDPASAENLTIEPNDVLAAESSGVVFLTGEVLRPGSFELTGRDSIGVAELISQAGGFSRNANPEQGKILRQILNGSKRAEIPVDIAVILDGGAFDFPVQPNDIVVVPRHGGKTAAVKSALRYIVPGLATTLLYISLR